HSWATTNIKYFCSLECRDKDVLIRSVGVGRIAKKGRYSLYDRGGRFTVSIKRLMKSDEGQYWCGVERSGIDTYQEVIIKVQDAPQVTAAPRTFGPRITVLGKKDVLISVKGNTQAHTPTHSPTYTHVTRGPGTPPLLTAAAGNEATSPRNVNNRFSTKGNTHTHTQSHYDFHFSSSFSSG
ncbi:hypothetical protein PDJAM_G00162200, partial [Pangasius djambal]|nr:hypothetical protein [Pangasius djambal]